MNTSRPPYIVFIPGDPNGIGPELTAKFFAARPNTGVRPVLMGDEKVIRLGCEQAGVQLKLHAVREDFSDVDDVPEDAVAFCGKNNINDGDITVGRATMVGGKSSLSDLDSAVQCVVDGRADGVCFAPLNKEAMIAGGLNAEDELTYLARKLQHNSPVSEINILQNTVWTSRVTSHVAIKKVPELITGKRILQAALLINSALRESGMARPRIAIAALNPHAGDGGNFGREEIDIIAPAVESVRNEGVDVAGPFPADTLFIRAFAGDFDGVVTMYHDQGQIAIKLTGFERGVSLLGGLPVVVTTPAHGTAFDIAGQGLAKVSATEQAFNIASEIVINRRKQS